MIFLRLSGGLGNQLFQLSAAIYLAKNNNIVSISIDDTALNNYQVARDNELVKFLRFDLGSISVIFKSSVLSILRIPKFLPIFPFVSDKNFHKSSQKLKNLFLDGHFQDCWQKDDFYPIVSFIKSHLLRSEGLNVVNDCCVIHVRGGDFVELGWNSVCDYGYYQSAIDYFKKQHRIFNFIVVTDDRLYASKLMQDLDVEYIFTDGNMASDFHKISEHPNRILSSSTFSFWASILGENPANGCVIAPKRWNPKSIRNITLPNEVLDI